jgi:hypothetical protein
VEHLGIHIQLVAERVSTLQQLPPEELLHHKVVREEPLEMVARVPSNLLQIIMEPRVVVDIQQMEELELI